MSKWTICIVLVFVLIGSSATPGVHGEFEPDSLCSISGSENKIELEGCPGDPLSGWISVTNTGEIGLRGQVLIGYLPDWFSISPTRFSLGPGQSVKMNYTINTKGFDVCSVNTCTVDIDIWYENGEFDKIVYDIVVKMMPPEIRFSQSEIDLGTLCPSPLSGESEHRIKLYINNFGCEAHVRIMGREYTIPARTTGYPVDVTLNLEPPSPKESAGEKHSILINAETTNCPLIESYPSSCRVVYRWSTPPEFLSEPIQLSIKAGESKTFQVDFRDWDNELLRLVARPPFSVVSMTNTKAVVTVYTREEDLGKTIASELELTDMCHTVSLPVRIEVVDTIYPPFVTEPFEFEPIIIFPSGVIIVVIEIKPTSEPPTEVKEEYDKPIIEVSEPQIDVKITPEDNGLKIEAEPDAERGCDIALVKIKVGDRETVKLIPITIKGGE
jgi:hypothetical protein